MTFEKLPVISEENQSEDDDGTVSHPYEAIPLRQQFPPVETYEQINENDGDDKITDDNRSRVQPKNARESSKTIATRDVDESNSNVPAGRSRRPPICIGIDEYASKSKRGRLEPTDLRLQLSIFIKFAEP